MVLVDLVLIDIRAILGSSVAKMNQPLAMRGSVHSVVFELHFSEVRDLLLIIFNFHKAEDEVPVAPVVSQKAYPKTSKK